MVSNKIMLSFSLCECSSKIFVETGPKLIGNKYMKAVYKEYTDETFTKQKVRSSEEEHMGLLGPYIKAEVRSIV